MSKFKLPFYLKDLEKNSFFLTLGTFFTFFSKFWVFFFYYLKKKVLSFSLYFEKNKDILVKFFSMKRGRYNRPFLHLTTMAVLAVGVIIAPFLADTYPIFSPNNSMAKITSFSENQQQSISVDENVFHTRVSQKPRDKVISYTVEQGDTLSTITKKFQISTDTIKWANDLSGDSITVGDELKILPVSGVLHKVSKGDTVYTIAKRYDTNPQQIVDFPFNDFANPETFSLVEGQLIIVPDGTPPTEKPTIRRQTYLVQGPISVSSAGFVWPLRGEISQFASWYHMALDITSPVGTPLIAARSGRVVKASTGGWDYGYGNNVTIDHGDGFQTHYAHMSTVNVSVGDNVVGGRTVIGAVGMTGRTTGPHVHFEMYKAGVLVNPLPYLQ